MAQVNKIQSEILIEELAHAEKLAGLDFTQKERKLMLAGMEKRLADYRKIRSVKLDNSDPPALQFRPDATPVPAFRHLAPPEKQVKPVVSRPDDLEEVAFWPVTHLGELVRTRQVTSIELTELYLARLQRFDPVLHCVITLTEDLAMAQAGRADEEMANGRYRGPLHGIPWGAKDLLAVKGYPTTWGAMPYKNQLINRDAAVVQSLAAAGAVLVAKLSMGALAWGDVWFGGKTRNPWNQTQGSSGSSAGSAAAVAAGLVGFAIGTETYGSIISPATRCGVTGLRPTFGRVSRAGSMALSWSMDKIGPICRSAADCGLVFAAIHGADGEDETAVSRPFQFPGQSDLSKLKIGYVESAFSDEREGQVADTAVLDTLRTLGADLIPVELPDYPVDALGVILEAEAAAAFDELTRSNWDDLLVRQEKDAWPNVFRQARLIPAVEYIQANRVRTLMMRDMAALMQQVDMVAAPPFVGTSLLLTNLTGHPAVVLPNSVDDQGRLNGSMTFIGRLFDEATILSIAQAYQEVTPFHQLRPTLTIQGA